MLNTAFRYRGLSGNDLNWPTALGSRLHKSPSFSRVLLAWSHANLYGYFAFVGDSIETQNFLLPATAFQTLRALDSDSLERLFDSIMLEVDH
jgi:hypothetical protein